MANNQIAENDPSAGGLTASESSNGGIDYVEVLLRYKWLILAGVIVGGVLGQLAYLKLGPQYDAYTQLLVSKRESMLDDEQDAKARSGDRSEHIALILSPMIVDRAIENESLDQLTSFRGYDDVTEAILGNLKAKRSAGQERSALNVVDITYTARYPADARLVVSAIIDAYGDYLKNSHRESTNDLLALIHEARTDIQKQLDEKEKEYLEFRKEAPLLWKNAPGSDGAPGDVTNVHQERVLAIEKERGLLLIKQAALESQTKSLEDAIRDNLSPELLELMVQRAQTTQNAAQSGVTQQANQSQHDTLLLPLLMQKSELERDFGPNHPKMREVNQRIAEVRTFYGQRGVRLPDQTTKQNPDENSRQKARDYLALMKQQLIEHKHRDTQLASRFETESEAAKSFTVYQSRDVSLVEEIQHLKLLRSTVENRAKTSTLEKDNTGYQMKQIAPIRDELVFKRHLKFLLGGIMAGAALAVGFAILRDLRDTRITSLAEIQRRIPLPMLGAIPESEARVVRNPRLDRSLTYFHFPESAAAEAYRSVRTAMHTVARGQKVLAVTSAEPGDGKSTLISNLAISLAQAGKNVLLIDADLRRPTIHALFGARQDIGLSEVLEGEIKLENATQPSEVSGLTLLTSGTPPQNPAELLSKEGLSTILEVAHSQFDLVLIDTPPVLAVSDACSIGQIVDGLLLIVRLHKTDRQSAIRALELIETHGVKINGVVANGYVMNSGERNAYGYSPHSVDSFENGISDPKPFDTRDLKRGEKSLDTSV